MRASLARVAAGGIPLRAEERLAEEAGEHRRLFTSDLTVPEFLLARDADVHPISQVMGSCIYHVGQIPCAAPDPPGCSQGLILKNGLCAAPSCQRGSLMVQSAGTAQCTFVADAKYPRWMELKWK